MWARLDPGLFSQCFTGQAKNSEAWCRSCHSVDHSTDSCPLKPLITPPPPKRPRPSSAPTTEVCRKFNRLGSCPFGSKCRYAHRCSLCGGEHPLTHGSAPKNSQSLLLSKQLLPCDGRHAQAFMLPRSSVISSYVSRLFPASLFMTVRTHSEATAILYISRSHVNLISAAYIYMYNLKPLLAVKGTSWPFPPFLSLLQISRTQIQLACNAPTLTAGS